LRVWRKVVVPVQQEYQKTWITAFWYARDQISAEQPSEETANSAANHGPDRAEHGPNCGAGRGTTGDFVDMPPCPADLIKLFVGEQHRRCKCMICSVRHCFAPSLCVAAGRY
jgi:hypothetical protein